MPNQTDFKVTITSMKAVDLPAMDVGGTSDPFVKVRATNADYGITPHVACKLTYSGCNHCNHYVVNQRPGCETSGLLPALRA